MKHHSQSHSQSQEIVIQNDFKDISKQPFDQNNSLNSNSIDEKKISVSNQRADELDHQDKNERVLAAEAEDRAKQFDTKLHANDSRQR